MAATREHILLAGQFGVPFISGVPEQWDVSTTPLRDLVRARVRELLSKYTFPGTRGPVIPRPRGGREALRRVEKGAFADEAILRLYERSTLLFRC